MVSGDTLPPLRDVVRQHGLNAKKGLGQNFLFDLNLTRRIARTAGRLENTTVIEVGPGPGGLTRALLQEGAKHVIAIERDERCRLVLEDIARAYPDRLTAVFEDALEIDYSELAQTPPEQTVIVANLPYNIGTPLFIKWLSEESWPPFYRSMTLMFQREVAERIVAKPGDNHYGRLAVLTGWRSLATLMFDVAKEAFTPPPKVTSSVVHIEPHTNPLPCSLKALEKVTSAAFGQRRKMLRQSLKGLGNAVELIERAGLEPTQRAETVDIEGFVSLANAYDGMIQSK
jgi:16S rRNA (adenine1518-N6/adenine1519-N6)-dimethyltransferase